MTERDPYQELLDESRHREALEERARERSLTAQLHEDAVFPGTLADLADHRAVMTLRTESGAAHQGWIAGVALDHVVVRSADGHTRYLALDAITDVRPDPTLRATAATGDRTPVDRTLREVLARLAPERPRVHVRVRGQTDGTSGSLISVGADVVSLRLDGGRGTAYVHIPAITELAPVD